MRSANEKTRKTRLNIVIFIFLLKIFSSLFWLGRYYLFSTNCFIIVWKELFIWNKISGIFQKFKPSMKNRSSPSENCWNCLFFPYNCAEKETKFDRWPKCRQKTLKSNSKTEGNKFSNLQTGRRRFSDWNWNLPLKGENVQCSLDLKFHSGVEITDFSHTARPVFYRGTFQGSQKNSSAKFNPASLICRSFHITNFEVEE